MFFLLVFKYNVWKEVNKTQFDAFYEYQWKITMFRDGQSGPGPPPPDRDQKRLVPLMSVLERLF